MIENGDRSSNKETMSEEDQGTSQSGNDAEIVRLKADIEMMKERFGKLLLGEDMSGGGKGVSSALALSNAITNLAASAFGEFKKLEPMSPEVKTRWRKEIDWMLSVTDNIVEFVPSKQTAKDGSTMEIMVTKQRHDLRMNVPALRKLDGMIMDTLDNFKGSHEFYYASKHDDDAQKMTRTDDKWWLPVPRVPPNGLSDGARKWLQYQKDSVHQVLKAAMAINAQVLGEMEIPESYIESLPKNGRASLGDVIYKSITEDFFDPDCLLSSLDLSSEHKIVDLKNKIEASIVIWRRKMNTKDSKSSWSSGVSTEKREVLEDRAETILLILKHRFPGISQSDLDICKIQFNRDVGHAVLESYSRIIESLAHSVLSRIEDVAQADTLARNPSFLEQKKQPKKEGFVTKAVLQRISNVKLDQDSDSASTPSSKTLLDFMGWNMDQSENDVNKNSQDEFETKPSVTPTKKLSYMEKLENLGGLRSPKTRH